MNEYPVRPPGFVPVPVCTTMLPARARNMLAVALQTDPGVPVGASPARTYELERALFHIRVQYPRLYVFPQQRGNA